MDLASSSSIASQAAEISTQASSGSKVNTSKTNNVAQAQKVGKDFESMFVTQMLNYMFEGLDTENGVFGGGQAEAMFRPMLIEQYGKAIANHGSGLGIADQVSRVLLSQQEV